MVDTKIIGSRYGRLTVVDYAGVGSRGMTLWLCKCECGNFSVVRRSNLVSGITKSCGCLRTQLRACSDGESRTRLYKIFTGMKQRCGNPNMPCYSDYGGRGIKICDEWSTYKKFRDWALANGYADGLTIERVDVNKGYSPDNCKWIPKGEQSANTRRTVMLELNGETKPLSVWCKELGINLETARARLRYGYESEQVLSKDFLYHGNTPSPKKRRKK